MEIEIVALTDRLRELLPQLTTTAFIEYGPSPQSRERDALSYLRIRLIECFGTEKYCIKLLSRGMEGSGDYFERGQEAELAERVMRYVLHYHRPLENKALHELVAKRNMTPLTFHLYGCRQVEKGDLTVSFWNGAYWQNVDDATVYNGPVLPASIAAAKMMET